MGRLTVEKRRGKIGRRPKAIYAEKMIAIIEVPIFTHYNLIYYHYIIFLAHKLKILIWLNNLRIDANRERLKTQK